MIPFSIIVAVDQKMGVGRGGLLPWHLPEDLKNFARVTKKTAHDNLENALIMGRKTWESIPADRRPLSGRINCVLSNNPDLDLPDGVLQFGSLDDALTALSTSQKVDQVFVIGGGQLYQESILHPELEKIYLTRIEEDFDCDTFFPDQIPEEFEIVSTSELMESDGLEYSFLILQKGGTADDDNEYIEFT
jgi:dihydrofolate reductase